MASGSATRTYSGTLVASTADTVTLALNYRTVLVTNTGAAAIYATTDTSTPTVAGAECWVIPANGTATIPNAQAPDEGPTDYTTGWTHRNTIVKLISSGTPTYTVEGNV